MTVQGKIVDAKTGERIPAIVTALNPNDQSSAVIEIRTGEDYTLTGDPEYIQQLIVVFSAQGYKSEQVTGETLLSGAVDIMLTKQALPSFVLLGLAAAMLVVLMNKRKRVGELTTQQVLPFILIAGAVLGFFLIKKILEMLGIWKDPDERELDETSTNPNSFWNPNFWMSKPDDVSWTAPITTSTAKAYARELYDSFNWYNDCEECAKAVMKRSRSQATASYIAWAFDQEYGQDLLTFLRGGVWPQDRLSDQDVNEINKYIRTLPKY